MITDREIAIIKEFAEELKKSALGLWPEETRYSRSKRQEVLEKAEILEKMCGMVKI